MSRRHTPTTPQCRENGARAGIYAAGRAYRGPALAKVGSAIRPGITTGELDKLAEETIRSLGAIPAFLGFDGFPATACISINEQVVHAIPGLRPVKAGNLVKVDLGAIVEGWYADAAYTYPVGEVSDLAKRLMTCGQGALAAGIAAAKPGKRVRDIGAAIQRYVEGCHFSVVRELCGHGIGRTLHEEPKVPNYAESSANLVLVPGMALAIEPMVNAGRADVERLSDGWTYATVDASLSVHYEHTVIVQPEGPEIITILR